MKKQSQEVEYYAVPVIPMDDDLLHTDERPVCSDPSCPCHEDTLLSVWQELQDMPSYLEQQAHAFVAEEGR